MRTTLPLARGVSSPAQRRMTKLISVLLPFHPARACLQLCSLRAKFFSVSCLETSLGRRATIDVKPWRARLLCSASLTAGLVLSAALLKLVGREGVRLISTKMSFSFFSKSSLQKPPTRRSAVTATTSKGGMPTTITPFEVRR